MKIIDISISQLNNNNDNSSYCKYSSFIFPSMQTGKFFHFIQCSLEVILDVFLQFSNWNYLVVLSLPSQTSTSTLPFFCIGLHLHIQVL
jgi:hypothetical protein